VNESVVRAERIASLELRAALLKVKPSLDAYERLVNDLLEFIRDSPATRHRQQPAPGSAVRTD
jgi:hypothetical protein